MALSALCAFSRDVPLAARIGVLLIALAYSGWYLYNIIEIMASKGSPVEELGVPLLGAGELLAVAVPYAFFAAVALPNGQWRNLRRWIAPSVVALLFAGGSISDALLNQGMTATITTWSLGFNIAWPWPLYAVGLALYLYSILTCFSNDGMAATYANRNTGLGLFLLLLAGYNLQLPYQHLVAVLSLILLTGLFAPFGVRAIQTTAEDVAPIPLRYHQASTHLSSNNCSWRAKAYEAVSDSCNCVPWPRICSICSFRGLWWIVFRFAMATPPQQHRESACISQCLACYGSKL